MCLVYIVSFQDISTVYAYFTSVFKKMWPSNFKEVYSISVELLKLKAD